MTKIKFLLFTLFCAVLTVTTSCSSGDDSGSNNNGGGDVPPASVTGVTLNNATLTVQVGKSETLAAALQPLGIVATVNFASQDPTIATVNASGVVTGVKAGTTTIGATAGGKSATCTVTVTAEAVVVTDGSLSGSDYFVIALDQTSFLSLGTKVIQDLRPDEAKKHLYVWLGGADQKTLTFDQGTPAGKNFYGLSEEWPSLIVGSVGWSGAGWNVGTEFGAVDMTRMSGANASKYVLHIGYKTSQPARPIAVWVDDADSSAKFAIGGDFVDGKTTYPNQGDLNTDGKWHSIEIPVTKLNELGVFFNKAWTNKNILSILAGGTKGTTVDFDAIFFYKKA